MSDPHPMPPDDEEDPGEVPWWRPDWQTAVASTGARWLVPLGLLGFATLFFLWQAVEMSETALLLLMVKLAVVSGVAAIGLGAYVVRQAVRARREPFCIFCGYNLAGLPERYRCPECGREYTPEMMAEYRRDPERFRQTWKNRQRSSPRQGSQE